MIRQRLAVAALVMGAMWVSVTAHLQHADGVVARPHTRQERARIVERPTIPPWQRKLQEERPALPGFRAIILNHSDDQWPIELANDAPDQIRRAAEMIGKRLAVDGLLLTTAQAIEIFGSRHFIEDEASGTRMLRDAGLPVDLLHFYVSAGERDSAGIVAYLALLLASGRSAATLEPELDAWKFEFRPTRPGFSVASESGEHELGMLRLQLTRGNYWQGQGDGGNLDLTRQLVESLPAVDFVISIENRFVEEFLALFKTWPAAQTNITVIPEPLTVSQWAQDNGKPGVIETNGSATVATIVPRYASRSEEASTFVPGETFLADGLAAAGMDVFQSPLLFQGGDLLAARDPHTGERILLIGEAEVFRNVALGLSEPQVLEAMRREFGVDRIIKVPAISFHIDFELTVRSHDGRLIAFVLDTPIAVRLVLDAAMRALAEKGIIDASVASAAIEHLRSGRNEEFLSIAGAAIWRHADAGGNFPLSFAELFGAGPGDSGVGNLQRVLLAMDMLVSETLDPATIDSDPHAQAYLKSMNRREADRKAFRELLAAEGFEVVPVPGMSDGNRGINPLNGIHAPDRYLMPAYGGLFAGVDESARRILERTLSPSVLVQPIVCSETQRRSGGLHCSVSVYPRVESLSGQSRAGEDDGIAASRD
jgi:hypothetical protein